MTDRKPQDYSDIATFRGQTSLLYQEFGSYQGEWLCLARDEDQYYLYKGWYGSCSGCQRQPIGRGHMMTYRAGSTSVQLEEDLSISAEDILAVRNLENRRRALDRTDIASFVGELGGQTIDTEGTDKLVELRGDRYLWLRDASTPRQYLLRVPPETERVRQGKAWSFDIPEADYAPLVET